ncbi:hypothetical protein PVAP13_6KG263901 [Panicum virgatum]|uniref:Uncharacterized protein n=1 Tax=Panicum virgatum TaxID=38727 RepID=A0A8T0R5N2_PANVG|nr:hypothetical protein PVAP13_6KG263901 [Panicum virgatum]
MVCIKLPKLCPYTWTVDLLDDSCCSERDRVIILCGMWSLWNNCNDTRHGKVAIAPELEIEWAMDVCFQLMTDSLSHKKGVCQSKHRWSVHSSRLFRRHGCSDLPCGWFFPCCFCAAPGLGCFCLDDRS